MCKEHLQIDNNDANNPRDNTQKIPTDCRSANLVACGPMTGSHRLLESEKFKSKYLLSHYTNQIGVGGGGDKLAGTWENRTLTNFWWKRELFHPTWKAIWKLLLTFKLLICFFDRAGPCVGIYTTEIKYQTLRLSS